MIKRPRDNKDLDKINEFNQLLNESKFYTCYDAFNKYNILNHRRAIRYLDGNTVIIAAVARDHFANLQGSQGMYFVIKGFLESVLITQTYLKTTCTL